MCIAGIDNVLLHSKLYDSVLTCVALQALTREVLPDPTDLRVHPVTRVPMVQSDDLENQVYTLLYVCYYGYLQKHSFTSCGASCKWTTNKKEWSRFQINRYVTSAWRWWFTISCNCWAELYMTQSSSQERSDRNTVVRIEAISPYNDLGLYIISCFKTTSYHHHHYRYSDC